MSPPRALTAGEDRDPAVARRCKLRPEEEDSLRQAAREFEQGEFIVLTSEQLELWTETGDFPWPDESSG